MTRTSGGPSVEVPSLHLRVSHSDGALKHPLIPRHKLDLLWGEGNFRRECRTSAPGRQMEPQDLDHDHVISLAASYRA